MSKEKKCVKISIIGAESVVLTTDYVLIMNGLTTDLVSEVELYNNVWNLYYYYRADVGYIW